MKTKNSRVNLLRSNVAFSVKVKEYLASSHKTQKEFAREVGVAQGTISNLIIFKNIQLKPRVIAGFAVAMGVSAEELVRMVTDEVSEGLLLVVAKAEQKKRNITDMMLLIEAVIRSGVASVSSQQFATLKSLRHWLLYPVSPELILELLQATDSGDLSNILPFLQAIVDSGETSVSPEDLDFLSEIQTRLSQHLTSLLVREVIQNRHHNSAR